MKDTVIIVGNFVMPDKDAAAHRVLGLAKALDYVGYKVVFQGKNYEKKSKTCHTYNIDNFTWKTRPPYNRKKYYFSCDYIIDTVEEIGWDKVKAIILYHQPSVSAFNLLRYCDKKAIKLITDTTEWYSIYQLAANKHAFFTTADFYFRILYVNKKIGNMIVISSYLKEFYQNKKSKVIQIPILNINEDYELSDRSWDDLRICYCGSPAKKDLLEPIVKAVQKTNENGTRTELHIVGVNKEDYCKNYPGNHSFDEYITFYGRVEHSQALSILRKCDFSMIIRRDERYARAGFPTKMVEALSNGVGVIATPCGDIPNYITNGENGYLVKFTSVEADLLELFNQIAHLSSDEIYRIKYNALETAKASFSAKNYANELYSFLNA